MAGHLTGLAWSNSKNESYALSRDFEDATYERERRQRMMQRIRNEEKRNGIHHPEAQEDKYDRWADNGRFDAPEA